MGGIAVINADDPYGAWFAERSRGARVVEYGIRSGDFRPEGLVVDGSGIRMTVDGDEYHTVLTGDFNVYNTLAAIAYSRARGWAPDGDPARTRRHHPIDGPHAERRRGQPFTAVVDFAHTPDAYEQLFPSLRRLVAPAAKLIAVFGCAGLRDTEKRETMPAIAAEVHRPHGYDGERPAHRSRSTRSSTPCRHPPDAQAHALGETMLRIPDRGTAILTAVQAAPSRATSVVACGKGHKQSMSIGGTEFPWDDRSRCASPSTAWRWAGSPPRRPARLTVADWRG